MPSQPARSVEDDHLSIVNRRHIASGFGRQEYEGLAGAVEHGASQAGEAEPVLSRLREFPLRFRRFRAGELEEVRRKDETAPLREPAPLKRKLMTGAPFGRAGGKL